jgi:hypothetical protein
MGSGRGKTRRVQSTRKPYCDPTIWEAFVAEHGISDEKILEYYLGDYPIPHSQRRLSGEEVERVMRELWSDWAATGALSFPAGGTASDYELVVREDAPIPDGNDHSRLYLREISSGAEDVAIVHARNQLGDFTLGDWKTTNLIQLITRALMGMG